MLALFGLAIGIALTTQDRPPGALDTDLEGVTVSTETTPSQPHPTARQSLTADRLCWPAFGGDPQRSLARPTADSSVYRRRKYTWTRGLDSYIEFPPVYCEGKLYVNRLCGTTLAIDAATGTALEVGRIDGWKPSTPAIDGQRLLVASQAGTVTALGPRHGSAVVAAADVAAIESSPVVVDGIAYFGSHDGRLFAVVATVGEAFGGRTTLAGASIQARRSTETGCASRRTPDRSFCLTANGREDLEHVPAARCLPLRELLCEPVH